MTKSLDKLGNLKADAGKPRPSLVPPEALAEVIRALETGAVKYGPENWRKDPDVRGRYTNSSLRHLLLEWRRGQLTDKDSGLHVLAHAIAGLLYVLEVELLEKKKDA